MNRKKFLQNSALGGLGLVMIPWLTACTGDSHLSHSADYKKLVEGLLTDWCDGMIRVQVNKPEDATVHGMLVCPACDEIHARSMDAVYPFMYLAKTTGAQKYLDAGIAAMEWANNNVSRPDGSWTNTLDPKSWNGITVFGAISLAEALYYHGDLLSEERRQRWTVRLEEAAAFVFKKFERVDRTNINYGATTLYALNLMGRMLNRPDYLARSKAFAEEIKVFFTSPNAFLYGEIKPKADKLSAKGLRGIDLGYNVEESLNGIVLYALHEKDDELLELVTKALNTHLEFMLPDGGWDNSWGTRMYKWSYWGSRTCDGSSLAYGMLADRNPAFGTAAVRNTELLQRCTADGLLHGGIHYVDQGIKPCVHHTFSHAKPLAYLLDNWEHLPETDGSAPLPRTLADGLKHFPELDTTMFARGKWRGTVTAYDAIYYKGNFRQAAGGALSVLYHLDAGLLFAASMPVYKLVEVYNQQPQPAEDFALTPRIETYADGVWYTNLFDRAATMTSEDSAGKATIKAKAQLKNEANEVDTHTAADFQIRYECSEEVLKIMATTTGDVSAPTAFVIPVLATSDEAVTQNAPNELQIQKAGGVLRITSSVPLSIKGGLGKRVFNMVPGAAAVPIVAEIAVGSQQVELSLELP
jgi:hypothetical protein